MSLWYDCAAQVSITSGVENMASNYPSEPKNAGSVSNPATPGSSSGGTVPDIPLPSVSSTPDSGQSGRETPSGGSGGGSQRRLATGTLLSGDRYKIDRLVAAGGMGAGYRAIDARFNRPCAVKKMLDEFQNDNTRTQCVKWFALESTTLSHLTH